MLARNEEGKITPIDTCKPVGFNDFCAAMDVVTKEVEEMKYKDVIETLKECIDNY